MEVGSCGARAGGRGRGRGAAGAKKRGRADTHRLQFGGVNLAIGVLVEEREGFLVVHGDGRRMRSA